MIFEGQSDTSGCYHWEAEGGFGQKGRDQDVDPGAKMIALFTGASE